MIFQLLDSEKEKKNMQTEPKDTIVIRAEQHFDTVGGLNPIQVEISDSRIINMLTDKI